MSNDGYLDKEHVVCMCIHTHTHTHNGLLLGYKKNRILLSVTTWMGITLSVISQRQMLHGIIDMWDLTKKS